MTARWRTVAMLLAVANSGALLTGCTAPPSEAELVREGRALFEGTCAACHGLDLKGTDDGPSFLDPIYAPNHHPDESFYRAAKMGVLQHHWNFGPMPPQISVTEDDVTAIIAYIRSRQRRAGVTD